MSFFEPLTLLLLGLKKETVRFQTVSFSIFYITSRL